MKKVEKIVSIMEIPFFTICAALYLAILIIYEYVLPLEFHELIRKNSLILIGLILLGMWIYLIIYNYSKLNFDSKWLIGRKESVYQSNEKKTAMAPPINKKYLSKNPKVGTVGIKGHNYITIPFDKWNVMHTLVIGGPGSKKTSTIGTSVLNIYDKNTPEMVIFATDIKPEIARRFTRWNSIEAVNFAEINNSYYGWDMYYGLDKKSSDDEVIKRMRLIADCLIINNNSSEKGDHFILNAKNILSAYLFGCYRHLKLDFIDSIRKLTMIDLQQNIEQLTEIDPHATSAFKLKELLGIYSGKSSDGFEDIKTTLTTNLYPFSLDSVRYALKNNPKKASPETLTRGTPKSVFLCVPDGDLQVLSPLYVCCIEMTLRHLMDVPEMEREGSAVIPVWLLLDEVGNLPKIPSLERAAALLRSRKCFVWMIVQSLRQISNRYGDEVCSALLEDCENILVLSAKDEQTCRMIREWCGQYREPKYSTSKTKDNNGSESETDEFRYIYEISDIRKLRSEDSLLIFTDGDWFRGKKFTYRNDKNLLSLSNHLTEKNDAIITNGYKGKEERNEIQKKDT